MKKIITFVVLIVCSLTANAQDAAKAKKLLDEVSAKAKAYKNIKIDFKFSLENHEENISQESKGNVTLKGDQYVLNFMGVTRIFDGSKIYTIIPEDEEVNISKSKDQDPNEITPSEMLTFYEKGYTYSMDIVQNVLGRKIQYVKLTPIDSKSEYKKILLGIDVQTKHIHKLIQIGKNGTETRITVNSFKTNLPLSETLFTFDKSKYADYYINELD